MAIPSIIERPFSVVFVVVEREVAVLVPHYLEVCPFDAAGIEPGHPASLVVSNHAPVSGRHRKTDRRELLTTMTLLAAIASAANSGLMRPTTASGTATAL